MNISYFDEINIINFVEKFKKMINDRNLNKIEKCKKIIKYYEFEICQYIKFLFEFVKTKWKTLTTVLKKKYNRQNEIQLQLTKFFLKTYIKKFK